MNRPATHATANRAGQIMDHVFLYRRIQARQIAMVAAFDARHGTENSAPWAANSRLYYCYWNAHDETKRTMERKLP
jgi:hypothetical protein